MKHYITKNVIYRVENQDGKLTIYREYYRHMNNWAKDGRQTNKQETLIAKAGGEEALLAKCVDTDIETIFCQLREKANAARQNRMAEQKRQDEEAERRYKELFVGEGATETREDTVYALLAYLNTTNWGTWELPAMTIGYSCHQYECDGKTATTITLDEPISVGGSLGTRFVYGAPRGHLTKYRPIHGR